MKSFDCTLNKNNRIQGDEQATDLLNNTKIGRKSLESKKGLTKYNNGFKILSMGEKGQGYKDVPTTTNNDLRCQSLPDSIDLELNGNLDSTKTCDNIELSNNVKTPPSSPKNESWFKTWPERCDKLKSNETSPIYSQAETPSKHENTQCKQNCDTLGNNINAKSKLTLNEALQNISLAYSPVTKQLHLVEPPKSVFTLHSEEKDKHDVDDQVVSNSKKLGHRRTEAGSFSSTISTLSDPSTSGSLLESDDRSISSLDVYSTKPRKKSLTNFFSK